MAQRIVMNARVIGAVQRDSPKLKVFMLSVLWSDETEVIVYRSFQDFRKFHRQLKKRFPLLNPFRRKDRLIPMFNGEARKTNRQQKGSKRSICRMRFLENYCVQLLKCDESVTRSSEVTQFFMPKDHDLQPDFTKNSVLVLLSDDIPDVSAPGRGHTGGHTGGLQNGNVSHPFVTQTYCCVAAYETKDTKNQPFKVAVDEKLDVLIKDPAGWWLVENEHKRLAWFPAPYLELLDEEEGDDSGFHLGGTLYCAVRTYTTKKDDEVSVPIGSVVEVLRKSDNGWWLIRFNGKVGYIPSMYLQPYNNPRAGLYSLQRKLHSSTLNLALSREQYPLSTLSPSIREEPAEGSDGPFSLEPSGRLHKARSLDILSETWPQRPVPTHASNSDLRLRSISNTSYESSLTNISSGSESSIKDEKLPQTDTGPRRDSSASSSTFSSISSKSSSESSAQVPKVPTRPRTEEILSRCTTMTRKAALATKTRLQVQPSAEHGR